MQEAIASVRLQGQAVLLWIEHEEVVRFGLVLEGLPEPGLADDVDRVPFVHGLLGLVNVGGRFGAGRREDHGAGIIRQGEGQVLTIH